MTTKQIYDEIVKIQKKLDNTSKKYGITDPAKREELQARLDYLKNAHKEALFSSRNSELRKDDLSSKLELDEELGYGKGIDLPERKEVRFTPVKKTEAQQRAMDNFSKMYNARIQLKEAAMKAAKEASPENDMYKVGRKYRLPFYLKKAITAVPKGVDGPLLAKIGAGIAGGGLSLAAEAASEAIDSEESGATPDMPDYWLERGIRDRDEQIQRARLSSFKKGLAPYDKMPSPYEQPERKKYKEDVLKAEREGTLRDNYVDDVQEQNALLADLENSLRDNYVGEEDPYEKFKKLKKTLK